jgi:hypothetical protein
MNLSSAKEKRVSNKESFRKRAGIQKQRRKQSKQSTQARARGNRKNSSRGRGEVTSSVGVFRLVCFFFAFCVFSSLAIQRT